MNPTIAAQAAQSAKQGQDLYNQFRGNANTYQGQYNTYQQQADQANKNVQNYTNYMQGEGSAGNQYHNELNSQLGQLGYDPNQMTAARANLNQANGALSAYSDFANQAASKWGMNAGGFAAANAGALGSLNNNIASNQGVVNGLSDLYKTAQTGANQFTGQVVQGEQNTLAGLQSAFQNAANQRDSSSTMMNFYSQLAQQQGGLNAQQQQAYAAATQAYAQAQQALAQASQVNQQVQFMNDARNKYGIGQVLGMPAQANTGIGVIAPGHTGITDANGNVTGVMSPAAANQGAANQAQASTNPISEFFTNPHALGQQVGNGIGNATMGVLHSALGRLQSNARIFGL